MKNTIDEIEGLLAKATPAPWETRHYGDWWTVSNEAGERAFSDGSACGEYSEDCDAATRDLIVALRNAAPDLIAFVRLVEKMSRSWNFTGIAEALARLGVKP